MLRRRLIIKQGREDYSELCGRGEQDDVAERVRYIGEEYSPPLARWAVIGDELSV